MIELWYTTYGPTEPPPAAQAALLARLPPAWQHRVRAGHRPARRQASLFGALLLQQALAAQARPYGLEQVRRTADNRPYLAGTALDFNLAHSGRYIVCALSTSCRVGIDIEQRRHTAADLAGFRPHFRAAEWAAILAAPHPAEQFYRLWTQKEAVAKADGRGLSVALRDIYVQSQQAELAGRCWHLRGIDLPGAAAYTLHVAASRPALVGPPRQVSFDAPGPATTRAFSSPF